MTKQEVIERTSKQVTDLILGAEFPEYDQFIEAQMQLERAQLELEGKQGIELECLITEARDELDEEMWKEILRKVF